MSVRAPKNAPVISDPEGEEFDREIEGEMNNYSSSSNDFTRIVINDPGPQSRRSSSGILESFIDSRIACHLMFPIYLLVLFVLVILIILRQKWLEFREGSHSNMRPTEGPHYP